MRPCDWTTVCRKRLDAGRAPASILALPVEVLNLVLRQLDWADAVRLSCAHPALREAASSLQVLSKMDSRVSHVHTTTAAHPSARATPDVQMASFAVTALQDLCLPVAIKTP